MQQAGGNEHSQKYEEHGQRFRNLSATNAARAKEVDVWLRKVETGWLRLSVESIGDGVSEIRLGEEVLVLTEVTMNSLSPDDVEFQAPADLVDADGYLNPFLVDFHALFGTGCRRNLSVSSRCSSFSKKRVEWLCNPPYAKTCRIHHPFLPGLIKRAQAPSPVAELQIR